jgi:hypothetical protein
MDDDQPALRKANFPSCCLPCIQKPDQLEKRIAERKLSVTPADRETNPIAYRIAMGMTKARADSDKS